MLRLVAGHEPVRDLGGGVPVLPGFEIRHVQPGVGIQDQPGGGQSGGEGLALAVLRYAKRWQPEIVPWFDQMATVSSVKAPITCSVVGFPTPSS